MNPEKLARLQASVRIGGKGSPRRKVKKVHHHAEEPSSDKAESDSSLKDLSFINDPQHTQESADVLHTVDQILNTEHEEVEGKASVPSESLNNDKEEVADIVESMTTDECNDCESKAETLEDVLETCNDSQHSQVEIIDESTVELEENTQKSETGKNTLNESTDGSPTVLDVPEISEKSDTVIVDSGKNTLNESTDGTTTVLDVPENSEKSSQDSKQPVHEEINIFASIYDNATVTKNEILKEKKDSKSVKGKFKSWFSKLKGHFKRKSKNLEQI